ncbi:hypothetical protein [Aminobacter sp. MDW-2]|uniref:hypothetical protein n=1 Tax=Aminobacter sp. MDW-2 TaxID=2666139 RepID=UPI0012B0ABF7|nr:hypothetical protein [Aminobacter sp. MDW-2]MRX32836.1 hypothetical protein [Aminobacter sp. MDW-2]QNH34507.1 hypothetical protein H5P29_00695 [Aminobacter sp. MDW-2]
MSSKRTFTVEEIERVLAAVAYIVVRHGEEYVPLLDRVEQELEEARKRSSQRDRARRILASLTKEVKGAQAV